MNSCQNESTLGEANRDKETKIKPINTWRSRGDSEENNPDDFRRKMTTVRSRELIWGREGGERKRNEENRGGQEYMFQEFNDMQHTEVNRLYLSKKQISSLVSSLCVR
ncbi:hypothetical protein Dimus_030934 [Dionaea muscipula]